MNHPSSHPAGHGITIGTPRFYDLSANLLFFGTRRRSYRRLLAAAGVQPGNRVLDIGCGPGYFARMLARAVGPNGAVVGIDAAPEMIDYARRRARRLANIRFETGAAEALALPVYPELGAAQQEYIVNTIADFYRHGTGGEAGR